MNLSTITMFKHANTHGVIVDANKTKLIQRLLLKMIKDFDSCCKKNDIFYVMCGGCALGAVRHKGWIPWDDDLDVFMTRESYNNFLKVYLDSMPNYTLHSPETTPELGMATAQLSLKGTVYRTQYAPNRENPGFYIDIFILENLPDNAIIRGIHGFFSLAFGLLLSCSRYAQDRDVVLAYFRDSDPQIFKSLKFKSDIGRFLNFFLSVKHWCLINNWWNCLCKNANSKLVTTPTGRKHYFGEMLPRRILCESIELPFEDIKLPVMSGYVEYFTNLYGPDFMTPPKDADKEVHTLMDLDFGVYKDIT